MTRKRLAVCGPADIDSSCGLRPKKSDRTTATEAFSRLVAHILADQKVDTSKARQQRFIDALAHSVRLRRVVARRWSRNRQTDDIIGLIQVSRASGDRDEAVWRCFLAAHLGRASSEEDQGHSASDLLCGFGRKLVWTWKAVLRNPDEFRTWLVNHQDELHTLDYGNHRKYESKQADDIWTVVKSFVDLAKAHGGPAALMTVDPSGENDDTFDELYRRLRPLRRFGRTGRFDFLLLLLDLNLISAEPTSCYLRGSTGPVRGAQKLWGRRFVGDLDRLAAQLTDLSGVSPAAVEDALCNWQKGI